MADTEKDNEELQAIEYLRNAQAHRARAAQAKLKELGIEAFPAKMKIDDKLQMGVSIAHSELDKFCELLAEVIVMRTLNSTEPTEDAETK